MTKLKGARVNQTVVFLAVCVSSAMLGFVMRNNKIVTAETDEPLLLRQSDEKVIERKESPNEPFEFGNLAVKKVKVFPRQKFSAASLAETTGGQVEDWLENLEFTIRNKSDKQIVYFLLELHFPETENDGQKMVYNLPVGAHPKTSGKRKNNSEPLSLLPRDTFTMALSAKELDTIKSFLALRNYRLGTLNKVVIKIGNVAFEDGIIWEQGSYYRPNPEMPGGYERFNQ